MKFQCKECQGIIVVDFEGDMVSCGMCDTVCKVPAPMSAGVVIDDFLILNLLGAGGMGNVYLAHEFSLDRKVALKILKDEISTNTEVRNSFIKEARSVASLNHPNIIQALKVGLDDEGILFFAMEYVEGQTLQDLQKQNGMLEEKLVIDIAFDTVTALGYAWEKRQLVHRDIKPENIMISNEDGRTKLMDLGLSCHAGESDPNDDQISGTPQYISPEQITGAEVDIRTDFYCLGATLYHLLSGEFPFQGSLQDIVKQHLSASAKSLKKIRPDLSEGTVKIIHKLMKKSQDDRYQTAAKLLKDLSKTKSLLTNTSKSKKHIHIKSAEVKTHVNIEKRKNRKDDSQKKKILAVLGLVLVVTFAGILMMASKMLNPKIEEPETEEIVKVEHEKTEESFDIVTEPVQKLVSISNDLSEKKLPKATNIEDLVHRYSFDKVGRIPDGQVTYDTINDANFLINGNIKVEKDRLDYKTVGAGEVKISGYFKTLLNNSLSDSKDITIESWIRCRRIDMMNNAYLSKLANNMKVPYDAGQDYYLCIIFRKTSNEMQVYLAPAGGKQERETYDLTDELRTKLNLVELPSINLRTLLGFKGFNGEVDELRIWRKRLKTKEIQSHIKLGPDKLSEEVTASISSVKKSGQVNSEKIQGLQYKIYYVEDESFLKNYKEQKADGTGLKNLLNIKIWPKHEKIGLVFNGYLKVPEKGKYNLSIDTNEKFKVRINGDVELYESEGKKKKSSSVDLHDGYNELEIVYCNLVGTRSFKFQYDGENGERLKIPYQWYFRDVSKESNEPKVIIADGADWSHYINAEAPPKTWYMNQIGEKSWVKKPTPMGYGEDGLKTVVEKTKLVHYFKRHFDLEKVQDLILNVKFDDGCVIYVNGKELERYNMPEGEIRVGTAALRAIRGPDSKSVTTVPVSMLKTGLNNISISVHNRNLSSSDLVFAPELIVK